LGKTLRIDVPDRSARAEQASLARDPFDVLLLECQATDLWAGVSIDPAFLHQLVDCYYAAVARAFASRVSEEVKRDLLVFQSAALVWIDVEELLNHLLVQVVSLFTWKADGKLVGWATYASQSVVHSNFIPPEILSASRGWLSSELGFDGLSNDKPLDQTIRTYCTFLQRAHSHKFAGRRDEALLLFVVALDLLLGLKGRSSESVANHAAVLVHRQLGHSLAVTVRRIKQLYDTRSQYVHAGKPVREADLAAVDEIAMEILWTLLATSGRNEIRDTNDWIKTLGFIFSAMSAGPTIAETEFAAIGVPPIGHRRVPPIRVERAGPDSPGSVISVSVPGEED
jgi:hypothetical protein